MQDFNSIDFGSESTLVVAHDAGAANQIIFWLKSSNNILSDNIYLSFYGPAELIFNKLYPHIKLHEWREVLSTIEIQNVVTGTGWATNIEHEARVVATGKKIRTIAFIDHWVNYKSRFQYEDKECLPDEIVVTDDDAFLLAKNTFNNVLITLTRSFYLEDQITKINYQQSLDIDVLYILEPIRECWGDGSKAGEFQALDFFMDNLSKLHLGEYPNIVLRPHPSDINGKYDEWCCQYLDQNVFINNQEELISLVSRSKIVVGCNSYALFLAHKAGKKVFSTLPPWGGALVLPKSEISLLSEM